TGKTTLARLIAKASNAQFIALSAVMAGVKDIRAAVESARALREREGRPTLLFLDEVHRFNKAQQDTFLPYVEDGTLTFVGATTENPSFEVISALLSRARVYVLRPLAVKDLMGLLEAALKAAERGLGALEPDPPAPALAPLARRVARMAVEDIGLADPRALALALDGWETYERLGTPEGELGVATAVVYLACAPKSNAMYVAMSEAMADVAEFGSLEVPPKLRNAPTRLMKNLGYGRDYRYAHDEPDAFAAGERYLPDELPDRRYYRPVPRGLEAKIGEALERLRARSPSKG